MLKTLSVNRIGLALIMTQMKQFEKQNQIGDPFILVKKTEKNSIHVANSVFKG